MCSAPPDTVASRAHSCAASSAHRASYGTATRPSCMSRSWHVADACSPGPLRRRRGDTSPGAVAAGSGDELDAVAERVVRRGSGGRRGSRPRRPRRPRSRRRRAARRARRARAMPRRRSAGCALVGGREVVGDADVQLLRAGLEPAAAAGRERAAACRPPRGRGGRRRSGGRRTRGPAGAATWTWSMPTNGATTARARAAVPGAPALRAAGSSMPVAACGAPVGGRDPGAARVVEVPPLALARRATTSGRCATSTASRRCRRPRSAPVGGRHRRRCRRGTGAAAARAVWAAAVRRRSRARRLGQHEHGRGRRSSRGGRRARSRTRRCGHASRRGARRR